MQMDRHKELEIADKYCKQGNCLTETGLAKRFEEHRYEFVITLSKFEVMQEAPLKQIIVESPEQNLL